MKSAKWILGLSMMLVAGVAAERDAKACGGCFAPPGPSTQVTAHRMAFAVTAKRTVLWDQIQYVGAPTDFGWVLPIRGKVDVGVSSDQLFDRLESITQPRVSPPPPPTCPPPEKRCRTSCNKNDFGAPGGFADASTAADTGSVDVWSTSVVGPYEATQLSATDGTALRNWLTDHGYVLPASIGPVIDKYITEGFGFLVIKLVPNSGDNRMVPIRIGFDGSSPTLPLRMIAAGSGSKVGIKLFVMGDGRWEAKNFANEEVATSKLVWDWRAMGSNLGQLEIDLINSHKGDVFLTETSYDVNKSTVVDGLPAGTTTTEAGTTVFSSITDKTELDAAFPTKTNMRLTRLFAELPLTSLGRDLDLQASMGGLIPQSRQAPTGVNFTCQTSIEIECPGISPDCSSSSGGDGGIFGNPDDEGVPPSGGSGAGFGCASSSSPATMVWALGTVAGLALFSAIRRKKG
jgi:hypothetical protein